MATTFNARSYSAVAYDEITGITTGVGGAAAILYFALRVDSSARDGIPRRNRI